MAFGKSPYGYTTQPVSPYYNPQMGQGAYSYGQQPFGAYTPNSAAQMPMQNATPNSATPSSQPARTNMVFVTSLEDAAVDGDEKLAAYYFAIVKGEMY